MKANRTLQIWAAIVLTFGPATGNCQVQTYFYSGPGSGYTGVDLSPQGLGYGGFSTTFGTISETLYYDSAADSLELVGSVGVSPGSSFINMESGFFGPPESGSATLVVGTGGSVSFDNTFYGVASDSSSETIVELLVPVSGSGTYNGQAFSGSWDIDIPMTLQTGAITPTSLTFSEADFEGSQNGQSVVPGTDLADAQDDGTYYYSWQLDGVVATAVPEPDSLALLALGLSALAFRRRR